MRLRELREVELLLEEPLVVVLQVFKPEVDDVELVKEEVLNPEVVEDDVVDLLVRGDADVELPVGLVFHLINQLLMGNRGNSLTRSPRV